jgi:hypothetical protein
MNRELEAKTLAALKAVVNGMPEEAIDTHVRNLLDRCQEVIKDIELEDNQYVLLGGKRCQEVIKDIE